MSIKLCVRSFLCAVLLAAAFAPSASAAEIHVLTIGLFKTGLSELAANYTKETGTVVDVKADTIGRLMPAIKSGMPAPDVIVLPVTLMATLENDKGLKPGTNTPLGRVHIALAVRTGSPHPDISTVEKFIAALRSAKTVVFTKSGPPRNSMEASIMAKLFQRPDFTGIHTLPEENTSGVGGLLRGDGDMALQGIPEILSRKGVEVVAPLPVELKAYYDAAAAVPTRATDEKDAKAFIQYITGPKAAAVWKSKGIDQL